jgi:PIN domain nuclease of toxin-antitoxin system
MKVLLDTHTFIWWDSQPEQLSSDMVEFLTKADTEKFVSVISLWVLWMYAIAFWSIRKAIAFLNITN